jgi:protein-S-isoprenylcysteine O-methyltransferase Ste14
MVILRRAIVGFLSPLVLAAIVLLAAGRFDLPWVWTVFGVLSLFSAAGAVWLDRGLVAERLRPGPGAAKDHHRALVAPFLLAHWILTGLDLGRFHWSDTVPLEVKGGCLAGFAAALAMNFWAMRVNRFYSSVIRIQTDRGHQPITAGPYRWVRHPGYAATVLSMLCGSLAMGSWIGTLPIVPIAFLFIRRIINEDRLLHSELAGYDEYSSAVRYRLIPGVW